MKNKKILMGLFICIVVFYCFIMIYSNVYKGSEESGREEKKYQIVDTGDSNGSVVYLNEDKINQSIVECSEISTKEISLDELSRRFPQGMYWNHEGNPSNNSPDSVTSKPCHSTYYDSSCCSIFQGGSQCHGLALYQSFLFHGGNVSTYEYGISHNINELQVGDVVRYRIPNSNYDHSIFITSISGDEVLFSDCNYDLHCGIRRNVRTTKTELASLIQGRLNSIYDFPNQYSETGFILSYSRRRILYDISKCDITVSDVNRYRGEVEPTIVVKHNGQTLIYGTDYDYYFNSKFDNGGRITIRGMRNYEGEIEKDYKVVREELSKCKVLELEEEYEFTGEEIKPKVKVINQYGEVIDEKYYEIDYEFMPIEPGTYRIYIRPNDEFDVYDGKLKVCYTIIPKDISGCVVEYPESVEFVGKALYPDVTVKHNDKVLYEDAHYTISYEDNEDIGEGKIIINGTGSRYKGTVTKTFKIYVKEQKIYAFD